MKEKETLFRKVDADDNDGNQLCVEYELGGWVTYVKPVTGYFFTEQEMAEYDEKWISVKDNRPEIGVIVNLVLQHSKQDVYSGFRANGGWYVFQIGEQAKYYIPNDIDEAKITHWQPLPTPPSKQ
jgi:hypothetical protein